MIEKKIGEIPGSQLKNNTCFSGNFDDGSYFFFKSLYWPLIDTLLRNLILKMPKKIRNI